MFVTSVATLHSTSSGAPAAPSSQAKAANDDFESLLASHAAGNDTAHAAASSAAAKGTQAHAQTQALRGTAKFLSREIKLAQRARPVDGAKPSRKATLDAAISPDAQIVDPPKPAQDTQPIAAVAALPVPVENIKDASPATANDTDDMDDAVLGATAPALSAVQGATEPPKPSLDAVLLQEAPPKAAAPGKQDVPAPSHNAITNTAPAKSLPPSVVEEIVTAAKIQPQNVTAPDPVLPPSPTAVSRVASLLSAVRGTITVSDTPRQVVPRAADAPVEIVNAKSVAQIATATDSKVLQTPTSIPVPQAGAKSSDNAPRENKAASVAIDAQPSTKSGSQTPAAPQAPQPDAKTAFVPADRHPQAQDGETPDQVGSAQDNAAQADTVAQPAPATPQQATQTVVPAIAVSPDAASAPVHAQLSASVQTPRSYDGAPDQPNLAALATAIAAKSALGSKTFDIRMDPPELGRVDVHLSVDRDGKVQAHAQCRSPADARIAAARLTTVLNGPEGCGAEPVQQQPQFLA